MKQKIKKSGEESFRICPHGSSYCACLHNLWSAVQLPGHPKYPMSKGDKKSGKKGKQRRRGGGIKTLIG